LPASVCWRAEHVPAKSGTLPTLDFNRMLTLLPPSSEQRIHAIAQARQAVLQEGKSLPGALADAWIERSWRRCLASGKKPNRKLPSM